MMMTSHPLPSVYRCDTIDNCMVVPTCYNRAKKANKMEMTPAVNIDSIDDRLINK